MVLWFKSRSIRRLTGSGSGFKKKRLLRRGHSLKSHPTDPEISSDNIWKLPDIVDLY